MVQAVGWTRLLQRCGACSGQVGSRFGVPISSGAVLLDLLLSVPHISAGIKAGKPGSSRRGSSGFGPDFRSRPGTISAVRSAAAVPPGVYTSLHAAAPTSSIHTVPAAIDTT